MLRYLTIFVIGAASAWAQSSSSSHLPPQLPKLDPVARGMLHDFRTATHRAGARLAIGDFNRARVDMDDAWRHMNRLRGRLLPVRLRSALGAVARNEVGGPALPRTFDTVAVELDKLALRTDVAQARWHLNLARDHAAVSNYRAARDESRQIQDSLVAAMTDEPIPHWTAALSESGKILSSAMSFEQKRSEALHAIAVIESRESINRSILGESLMAADSLITQAQAAYSEGRFGEGREFVNRAIPYFEAAERTAAGSGDRALALQVSGLAQTMLQASRLNQTGGWWYGGLNVAEGFELMRKVRGDINGMLHGSPTRADAALRTRAME